MLTRNWKRRDLQGVLWLDKDHEDMEVLGASYIAQVINQQNKLGPDKGGRPTLPLPVHFGFCFLAWYMQGGLVSAN